MSVLYNILDSAHLVAIGEEIIPAPTFFRDRYFPTGAEDIFSTQKVLTEIKRGSHTMACFVAPRVGDIPVDRIGYEIHEFEPPYIAPSRLLTLDDLEKKDFGEAILANLTPEQRAARLTLKDGQELDVSISRLEEWMAVQAMLNNGVDCQEYIDESTQGEVKTIRYYHGSSEHTYTVATRWDETNGDCLSDIEAMGDMLAARGLPAADLILGSDAAEAFMSDAKVEKRLDKTSGIILSALGLAPKIVTPGVVRLGTINAGGHELTVFKAKERYYDRTTSTYVPYFPTKGALVTAPGCGHMLYGAVSQIDYSDVDISTYAGKRIMKLSVNQEKDTRKLRLASRPLPMPKNYCPWTYAADVVG